MKKLSLHKTIIFSLLPAILLLVFAELTARVVYYQKYGETTFALYEGLTSVARKIKLMRAGTTNRDIEEKYAGSWEALFSPEGVDLRLELQRQYEENFKKLVDAAQEAKTKLIVVYVPYIEEGSSRSVAEPICRGFFRSLTEKYGVTYFDFTDQLRQYDWADMTLNPHDEHFSRFGNRVIAKQINSAIKRYTQVRSTRQMDEKVKLYGDQQPNQDKIWNAKPRLAYRVYTNSQGLRAKNNLGPKSRKQRILILGDSITFCPYMPNHDTFPAWMERLNPDLEVINTGHVGYSINSQAELFIERAQYTAPDITILQVLDNDIHGLLYFKKNQYDRKGRIYKPSKEEERFLKGIEEKNKN